MTAAADTPSPVVPRKIKEIRQMDEQRYTDTPLPPHYMTEKCRGHWHVTGGGETLVVPGDPFATQEDAQRVADRLNATNGADPSSNRIGSIYEDIHDMFARAESCSPTPFPVPPLASGPTPDAASIDDLLAAFQRACENVYFTIAPSLDNATKERAILRNQIRAELLECTQLRADLAAARSQLEQVGEDAREYERERNEAGQDILRLRRELERAWRERERATYDAANALNVAELDAACCNQSIEIHSLSDQIAAARSLLREVACACDVGMRLDLPAREIVGRIRAALPPETPAETPTETPPTETT